MRKLQMILHIWVSRLGSLLGWGGLVFWLFIRLYKTLLNR